MITEAQRLMTDPKALAERLRAHQHAELGGRLMREAADIIDPLGLGAAWRGWAGQGVAGPGRAWLGKARHGFGLAADAD